MPSLLAGEIDLENVNTVPSGTHVVGEPINDCGPPGIAMVVLPSGSEKAEELRRDYNCGLALIRANGVLADLCADSTHEGGDPNCILEGPAPTAQCLADNPTEE